MRNFFIVVFTLYASFGFAQSRVITFSGRVTDSLTGQPLSGASIYFTEARIGTLADQEGNFIVRNVPSGHHLIEVSHTGYSTAVDHVDLVNGSEKNFALQPAITEYQGVTVTGVTSATNSRQSPIPVTLIRRNQLLQTPSISIIDALARRPGVSQINTGPAISKPVIRGLGYNRVVVINDGIRQEGQQWGDEHGIEVDELSVNRAEILKGPASIMYGSDALAGVINLITNTPVTEGVARANLYTNYQTNNGLSGSNASFAGNKNGWNWNAYGSYKSAGDYRNRYDGRVLNSRFNERSFGGYFGVNKSWGFSHLIFSAFNQNVGLVEGERDSATGAFLLNAGSVLERIATSGDLDSRALFIPNQNVRHYRLISDNSITMGRSRLKLNLGYQNNLRTEYGNPEDPEEKELFFDLKTINYNVQLRLPEKGTWEKTIGLNGMFQNNTNRGQEAIIPEYGLVDVGAFLFTQKTMNRATFTGGLRYDNRTIDSKRLVEGGDIKFAPFRKQFSNVSGTAGISYYPNQKITIRANVAKGFRAPALPELASNGAHEGTNRYEFGQLELKSEKSIQGDLGADLNFAHFSFSVSGFYNRINDFIFYRRLQGAGGTDSIIDLNGEELEAFQYNQDNAKLYGLEASFDLHPHPLDWLHFENSLSLVRGQFDEEVDGSNNLPMIPAPRWNSELRANFPKWGDAFRNFYVTIEREKTFRQNHPFTGYNTETATRGYALLNAGFGADISGRSGTLFSIHIAGNNLTDRAYQHHLNRLKYTAVNNLTGRQGVFNMGRNFSVKVNIPLSFTLK